MASITDTGRKYAFSEGRAWARFAILTCGTGFLAFGLFLAVALASHDPADPSWNQSISATARTVSAVAISALAVAASCECPGAIRIFEKKPIVP